MGIFRREIPKPLDPSPRELLDTGMRCYAATGGGEYFDGYTDALATVAALMAGTNRVQELLDSAARCGVELTKPNLEARR